MELGIQFKPLQHSPKIIFLLGCDNNISPQDIPKNSFVVYIGSFGDQGAQYADVILPASAFSEASGTFGIDFILYSKHRRQSSNF